VPAERLAPLPSLRASVGRLVIRNVDRLSCVRFASARYSVPTCLVGASVGVRTDDGRLLVIVTGTGEVVAEHTLVAPGKASILDAHYGGQRRAPRRAARPKTVAEKGVLRARAGRRGIHHRRRRRRDTRAGPGW
jgi:hypothetical protein